MLQFYGCSLANSGLSDETPLKHCLAWFWTGVPVVCHLGHVDAPLWDEQAINAVDFYPLNSFDVKECYAKAADIVIFVQN